MREDQMLAASGLRILDVPDTAAVVPEPDTSDVTLRLQIQRVFDELESLPQDAQLAFCSYLLHAAVDRLTAASIGKAISSAHASLNQALDGNGDKGNKKQQGAKPRSSKSSPALLESQLGQLHNPTNPIEAWTHFGGRENLLAVLSKESVGALELMLAHPDLPPGKAPRGRTSKSLATAIVDRLALRYGN